MNIPLKSTILESIINKYQIKDFGDATIREIVAISNNIEKETGCEFIHMEMGIPGLPASKIGVNAEKNALENGVASIYPIIDGLPQLKKEASRFVKAFIDLDIQPEGCVPVVGSMQGTFASFLTCCQCQPKKDTILFIDPGFPVQKQQLVVMGYKAASFDVYNYRGELLESKLEEYLKSDQIAAIIYSNPNNPSWICLNDTELKIIGTLAKKYDTIVIEDLAYFAMDFRKDLGTPFKAPFQSSVGKYTDQYILLISASKAFSYAGQRIGVACISDGLYHKNFELLLQRYGVGSFGSVFIHRVLYALSSGTSHSAQYALAAMFKETSDGNYHFLNDVKEYERRAAKLKKIFLDHRFHIVYDKDLDAPVGDGFYFTIGYKNMSGKDLMKELLKYGISAISLKTTGSHQEGLRACVSFIKENQYELLDQRLCIFEKNN